MRCLIWLLQNVAEELENGQRSTERPVCLPADEIRRLDEQLRRALEGEAWHGASVLEALEGVSAEQARSHPIP